MSSIAVKTHPVSTGTQTDMASADATVLASIALGGIAVCGLVAWLSSNPMFAFAGGGASLIALLLMAAFAPSTQATKPAGPSTTNTLSMVALVAACASGLAVAAIVLGHVARNQIGRDGGRGDKMALAALIVGYGEVALSVLAMLWIVTFIRFS